MPPATVAPTVSPAATADDGVEDRASAGRLVRRNDALNRRCHPCGDRLQSVADALADFVPTHEKHVGRRRDDGGNQNGSDHQRVALDWGLWRRGVRRVPSRLRLGPPQSYET